jgi:hypothetical protein
MENTTNRLKMRRMQRKRKKGWKMPPNTVYVGRATRWGNPYKVGPGMELSRSLELYREHLEREVKNGNLKLDDLHGKNLACWCSLNKPCHADILIAALKRAEKREANKTFLINGPFLLAKKTKQ